SGAESAVFTHFLGNHLIDVNGNDAASEVYILAYRVTHAEANADDTALRLRAGRYMCRSHRDDDNWLFTSLTFVEDWCGIVALAPPEAGLSPVRGSRSTADPVYSHRP